MLNINYKFHHISGKVLASKLHINYKTLEFFDNFIILPYLYPHNLHTPPITVAHPRIFCYRFSLSWTISVWRDPWSTDIESMWSARVSEMEWVEALAMQISSRAMSLLFQEKHGHRTRATERRNILRDLFRIFTPYHSASFRFCL